mmetsp:Transcript_36553/g.87210  ORF Transcript_36553/g.87210 Transcript_36553/m.87210 type:complete len:80 (-) Transcript_36553:14-253(-)
MIPLNSLNWQKLRRKMRSMLLFGNCSRRGMIGANHRRIWCLLDIMKCLDLKQDNVLKKSRCLKPIREEYDGGGRRPQCV